MNGDSEKRRGRVLKLLDVLALWRNVQNYVDLKGKVKEDRDRGVESLLMHRGTSGEDEAIERTERRVRKHLLSSDSMIISLLIAAGINGCSRGELIKVLTPSDDPESIDATGKRFSVVIQALEVLELVGRNGNDRRYTKGALLDYVVDELLDEYDRIRPDQEQ